MGILLWREIPDGVVYLPHSSLFNEMKLLTDSKVTSVSTGKHHYKVIYVLMIFDVLN